MAPLSRSDVPENQVWNLTAIFPSEEAFSSSITDLQSALTRLSAHVQTLGEDADAFLHFLRARDETLALALRIFTYAELRFSEDASAAANQQLFDRALGAWYEAEHTFSRLQSACLSLPEATLAGFERETGGLAPYREYVRQLVQLRQHKLTAEAEAALAGVSETLNAPGNIFQAVTGADLRCGTVADERGEEFLVTPFSVMLRSETSYDGAFRERAYKALVTGLKPYHNTLGAVLTTEVKKNVALAKVRGYASTAEMLLNQSDSASPGDCVSVSFFERVPQLILGELAPHMQRYARLRAKVWGVEKLQFYDVKAPAVNTSAKRVTFDEVRQMILGAVAVMGDEYLHIVETAFQDKWIYWGDNVGAQQGAFCAPVPGTHPYVFDPFHGILYDAFTLIHELGHAAHTVYSQANQVQQNTSSSRLFVEAPSTFNEHLLGQFLRQSSDANLRMRAAALQLFTFHHNFVTHLIEGELLRRIYRLADAGESVTTGVLDEVQVDILKQFWGDTVNFDDSAALTWMRQPHYYAGLYPYTYSVGLTASTALAERLQKGEDITQQWIDVLKLGGSQHALDLFRNVSLELDSAEPYRAAIGYVARLIDELEEGLA